MKSVITLIKKEALIEWRTMHTLVSVLLYVACTVFALYMMIGHPDNKLWNALFWVAQLFVIVNAVGKSFIQENSNRNRYYYTIVAPWQYILAKILYNIAFVSILALLSLFTFTLLLGNIIQDWIGYYSIALLGSGSLSVLFTFLSAIAAQAQQGAAMTAILGFPIAIPLILLISNVSVSSVTAVSIEGYWGIILMVFSLTILMLALALILFPFLWTE